MSDETFTEFTEPAPPSSEVATQSPVDGADSLPTPKASAPPTLVLTDEQQAAVDTILKWLVDPLSPQEFKLGGYAGTGKTTVIKAIKSEIKKLIPMRFHSISAFTGKAVNVLQRKGLNESQTLHSLMYDVDQDPITKIITFSKKYRLEAKTDIIIVDESSMLSSDLYRDVKSFNTKLLFVGDPGQLEPVGDNPDLMRQPDLILSKIHRQAESSPIITLANNVRHGARISPTESGDLIIRSKAGFTIPMAAEANQVICAKNKTRTEINKKFRVFLERPYDNLLVGDKLIVLRNNQPSAVFNGMILFVDAVKQSECETLFWKVDCHDEVDRKFYDLRVWKDPFFKDIGKDFIIPKWAKQSLVYADWGYCITCHKSQGSEWDHVLVWDEYMPPQIWDMRRWRYTAITRAAKKLTYCI